MMFGNRLFPLAAQVVFVLLCVSTLTPAAEMRVLDLLIAKGATDVTYVKRRGDVRYEAKSDFKTMGNFYAKNLAAQGWSKSAKDNLQRNFWVQTFSKGKLSLVVRVSNKKGGTDVRLTPTGMMWEEDDQPTPKGLPIPPDATDKEYSDFFEWIEFKSPSNVRSVEEFMTGELAKREWTKTDTSFDRDDLVMIKFTKQKSSISLDIRDDDEGGSEVKISTKGMQWDGMKAEIAQAKKKAEQKAEQEANQLAAAKEAEFKANGGIISLPKRMDKPKQGIDRLPQLPNECIVVMDGKTYNLTSIIAFEVFQHDEWSTKILATEKPIKQASLLAKLRKNGTDEVEGSSSWGEPYLLVQIEDDNDPRSLVLRAGGTPGLGSGSDLTGSALVEDGRARGTVKLTDPGSFFDKIYTADITFDVPVLTRNSTPLKRIANAPKLANSGKLMMGNKTYNLANVVAYGMKRFDDPMTTIVLSQRPLNMTKLKSAIGKPAADDYFEFTPQVRLLVDENDKLSSVSIWAENASVSGNDNMQHDIAIEDGRARGTARMTEPDKFMNRKYSFEASFDVSILGKRASTRRKSVGGLTADSYDGLPVPVGYEAMHSQGSPFRKESNTTVTAELKAVVEFYRSELASGEWGAWKEDASKSKVEQQTAKLVFTMPNSGLIVQLKTAGRQTAITLVSRDAQAAKAMAMLPAPGKSRLFLANESDKSSAITINKREYTIKAGAGAKDPKTGFNWEVGPGNYTVEVKPPRAQAQSETVKIGAGETWGVIIDRSGGFQAVQLY